MTDLPTTAGGWKCVCIDFPWTHQMRTEKGYGRAPRRHYATMPLAEIMAFPLKPVLAKDAWVFIWATWPHMQQAFRVIDAMGLRYSSSFLVWAKLNPREVDSLFLVEQSFALSMGYTSRKQTEPLILAKVGHPPRLDKGIRELLIAPRREHSRKPEEAYRRMERFCSGPRLDLFARESRVGWTTWGAESTKFDEGGAGAVSHDNAPARPARVETAASRPSSTTIRRRKVQADDGPRLCLDGRSGEED